MNLEKGGPIAIADYYIDNSADNFQDLPMIFPADLAKKSGF